MNQKYFSLNSELIVCVSRKENSLNKYSKMKVAVVLLTFVVCAMAFPHHDGTDHDDAERKEKIKKIHEYSKQCVEETGTTEEVSKKLVNGDFSVRDEKAQCYVKCFFQKVGIMNEAGEPQSDVILEKLKKKKVDTEDVEGLVKDCVSRKGENDCETAFNIYECYRVHVTYEHEFKKEEEKKPE
ncbi:general odorant-binding protein 56a-like [Chironomus tepperi]|uniref:general odorant-binding protein 56a-like n=1 Tax=Chironomus tepperi TaxID=113505 RepID=UPI00391F197A